AFATEFARAVHIDPRPYPHTSPEFACKKLLSAGEKRIFEFARVFRNRERGPLHTPEFTMLEWYRVGESYDTVISDCLDLLRVAARAVPSHILTFHGSVCDPFREVERLTVAEAFQRFAGIDLLSTLNAQGEADCDALARTMHASGIEARASDSWSDLFSKILIAHVEPRLGIGRPTILYEYPRCEAALARATTHDPRVAERFEMYACGVELANGFGELTDPVEERRRDLLLPGRRAFLRRRSVFLALAGRRSVGSSLHLLQLAAFVRMLRAPLRRIARWRRIGFVAVFRALLWRRTVALPLRWRTVVLSL